MSQIQELVVNVLDLRGSFYQIGLKQGQEILNITPQIMLDKDTINTAEYLLKKFSPHLLEELEGLAEGTGLPLTTVISTFSGYDVPFPNMGCSTLVKDSYYVRNYDFSPDLYDARLMFVQPATGFASVGFSQQIIGRLDGMNEKGLVIGLHFVNQEHKQPGFLATTIVRMVLDQCKTTSEAIDLLRKIPHGYCYNYSLTDIHGNSVIMEASPQHQEVSPSSSIACTNHFETNTLQCKNQEYIQKSIERKRYLQTLIKEDLLPEEVFYRFNHHHSPLFFQDYKDYFGTLHTVLYSPLDLSVMVSIGGKSNPLTFSFKEWLNGTLNLPSKITGILTHN